MSKVRFHISSPTSRNVVDDIACHDKEIYQLKQMIMSEVYIENRESLIDTLASHGEFAKAALKDIISKIHNDHQLKTYALKKLETIS